MRSHYDRKAKQRIALDRILLGDESGIRAAKIATLFDNPLRPSTRMSASPHVLLLREYDRLGESLFEPSTLRDTAYYQNAFLNIDIIGHYFDARTIDEIPGLCRRFVDQYLGRELNSPKQKGQSAPDSPIRVRPIKYSSCVQLVDGHHRVACAIARGESEIDVVVGPDEVLTPMQRQLLDVMWLKGRRELYQPIELPELEDSWVLVRKCSDRLDKMVQFLDGLGMEPGSTYLDLGSSYGWFTAQMLDRGFDSFGVERDPIATSIGPIVYGLDPHRITRSDIVRFLRETDRSIDFVSCFSVLHHFHMTDCGASATDVLQLIDRVTKRVLFFDMGHCGEAWFRERLAGWTHDRIEEWLHKNTTFKSIVRLGADEDAIPPFADNYSRMLFACVR